VGSGVFAGLGGRGREFHGRKLKLLNGLIWIGDRRVKSKKNN
jgi:hypothetical protein